MNDIKIFWQKRGIIASQLTKRQQSIILNRGSLTKQFRCLFGNTFNLCLLNQYWGKINKAEKLLFGSVKNEKHLIRQVLLLGDDKKQVFARTAIPKKTVARSHGRLISLNNHSIGDLLFQEGKNTRVKMLFCSLKKHELPGKISIYCPLEKKIFWVRISLFILNNKPLTITEYFLNL